MREYLAMEPLQYTSYQMSEGTALKGISFYVNGIHI